jgi:glycosyltransferase involved in cell wall biosynthesis
MIIAESYYRDFEADLVSVVIPVFNGAATIAEAIESCLGQNYPKIEIVVVDDGSTDATAEVLRRFGSAIRVVSQANKGLAAARNAGMREARGEFIAWLDADDIAFQERCAVQVQVLRGFEGVALVSSDFSSFLHNGPELEPSHIGNYYSAAAGDRLRKIYSVATTLHGEDGRKWEVLMGNVYPHIVFGSFVHPPTVMLRRQSLRQSGWCDESLRFPDFDFLLASARQGKFAYIDAPLLRYRYHDDQTSGPKHGPAIHLETVHITEKLRRCDPEFYRANRRKLEERMANCTLLAARQLAPIEKLRALRLMTRSLRHKVIPLDLLRVLFRILVPAFVLPPAKALARKLALLKSALLILCGIAIAVGGD